MNENENPEVTPTPQPETPKPSPEEIKAENEARQRRVQQYVEQLRLEQNLPFGILAGLAGAIIGAILWAVITVSFEFQIGFMAIGVGLLVGFAMQFAGKGLDQQFGIAGGALALLGCILGNYFTLIAVIGSEYSIGFFEVISTLPMSDVFSALAENTDFYDILFYGIAVYEGYKFAFRRVPEEEMARVAAGKN